MKKIIAGIAICVLTGITVTAQDQSKMASPATKAPQDSTSRSKYYYYPSQNVYYNDVTSEYSYYDESSTSWKNGKNLPDNLKLEGHPMKYTLYSAPSDNIWKDNSVHKVKYKVRKDGTIKEKIKD